MRLTNSFFALTSAVVFMITTRGVSAVLGPLDSGFGLTCRDIHLIGSGGNLDIAATCTNEGGGDNGVQILSLNSCLVNSNGALGCQEGGRGLNTCFDCNLSGTMLTCTCFRANGGTDTTSIDLNSCIGNQDGLLHC